MTRSFDVFFDLLPVVFLKKVQYGGECFHVMTSSWAGRAFVVGKEVTPVNPLPLAATGSSSFHWKKAESIETDMKITLPPNEKTMHTLTKTCSTESCQYRIMTLPLDRLYTGFTWLLHKLRQKPPCESHHVSLFTMPYACAALKISGRPLLP